MIQVKLPQHIKQKLKEDKDYYSLDIMENIEKAKTEQEYLGDLILANEDLIWFSIHKYIGNPNTIIKNKGLEKDDVQQLGRLGFIKAIRAFDTAREVRFSSFAVITIVREVRCYIRDNANLIRLTRTANSLLNNINKIENRLGYLPSPGELSEILGEKEEKITKVLEIDRQIKYLDEFIPNEEAKASQRLMDFLCSDEDVEQSIIDKLQDYVEGLKENLKKTLSKFELTVLSMKLQGKSQTSIAKNLDVSPMRITRTLKKMASKIRGIL